MENDENAFEKTVLKPMPGGMQHRINNTSDIATDLQAENKQNFAQSYNLLDSLAITYAENPIVSAASTLIYSLITLRHMDTNNDPDKLRQNLIQAIKNFDQQFYQAKINTKLLLPSRYVLCTVVDEFAMLSQWGQQSQWNKNSLLSIFHKEVWGGEKIFVILDKLRENVPENLYILELIYICLNLGFEGKFRVLDDGKNQVVQLKNSLYQQIKQQRGQIDKEISPSWKGVHNISTTSRVIPAWVVASVAGVTLLLVFSVYSLILNSQSSAITDKMADESAQDKEQIQVISK